MTADAKVGLLLGLFFIVIIAFLVNGLPNFIQEENPSPPSATIITPTAEDIVLGNSASDAAHRLFEPRSRVAAEHRTTQPPQETVVLNTSPEQTPQVEIPDLVPQPQTPVVIQNDPLAVAPEVAEVSKVTHVVKPGENLAIIAQAHYDEEQGNRRVVIRKLFEANTSVLKSPDHVRVGQKLEIPPLEELLNTSGSTVKAPNATEGLLKKFPAIFKRASKQDAALIAEYTVQKGDNLWSIAEQKLGDGARYKEIAQLNKGKIKNENDVVIGTRLIIPPQ